MDNRNYLVYLHSIGISQKRLLYLFSKKENYKEFYEWLNISRLKHVWFSQQQIVKIMDKKHILQRECIDEKLKEEKISIIVLWDDNYPDNLSELSCPPFFLYVKWKLSNDHCLSVIGTRKMSSYGKRVIRKLISELCNYFTIVSGWAYGCDTEAHKVSIQSWWKTIVVVGTGIDVIYPSINKNLYDMIVESGGAIISIFPLWEKGTPYNFPIRNEIIAGFSLGTLVIEAWERSWTLITANLALEQWRDLFVVPWEIDKSNSIGCNMLLKRGEGKITICVEDILEEYNCSNTTLDIPTESLIPVQKDIYELLSYEPLLWDEISQKLGISIWESLTHISYLELKRILRKNQEWKYELS